MGKENGKFTEIKKKLDLLDYGAVAVGFIFGLPVLIGAGAFGLAMDYTVNKEIAKKFDKKFKKKK
jgi:hypothetical protein